MNRFFAQIKSVSKRITRKLKVYPRHNVEKRLSGNNVANTDDFLEIDAIPYRIDTSLLLTVQSLGAGVPVLLFLVTLDTENLYFICINDAIDKCILPSDDKFEQKKTKTIYIPVQNMISNDQDSLIPLRFLAKRSKLYSAFSKFSYQGNQIPHLVDQFCFPTPSGNDPDLSAIDTLLHFVKVIERYDFWKTINMWQPIPHMREEILKLERLLVDFKMSGRLSLEEQIALAESVSFKTLSTWHQLENLNDVYEELCREWFLPTYLAQLTSYK